MSHRNVWPAALALLALLAAVLPSSAEEPLVSPESQGVSSRQILNWIRLCERPGYCLHGFVIRRHGKVIAEGSWAPFDTLNRPHALWSHSKTFTATAIGFLADEGKLDLDERVIRILPDKVPASPSENLRQLRVRDVLTMNLGAGRTDAENDDPAGDWEKALLATKYDDPPGTVFRYDSGATYLLSAIVGRKSGTTTMDYLREKLFEPLGICNVWSSTSPSGTPCGGWGMRMTTRDISKFGQLLLDRGMWQGRPLLSSRWVDLAGTYQTASLTSRGGDVAQGYGFQCWRSLHGYRADGAFGQFTLVLPELDAVVSLHAAQQDQRDELKLVWSDLLPAFREGVLPENQVDCATLREACRTLTFRTPQSGVGKADSRLFGVTYAVTKNRHISSVRLAEEGDGWRMTFVTPAGEYAVPVGRGAYKKGRLRFTNAPYETIDMLWGELDVVAAGSVGADGSLSVEVHPLDHTPRSVFKAFMQDGVPKLSGNILSFVDNVIVGTAK